MIVRVLGSAAGGGVPQWNCACDNCRAARAGRRPARLQSGFAVSADGTRWLLINCSPDIGAQIEAFTPLQPRAGRGTPIAAMLFTDANVNHIGGLSTLRQSGAHRFTLRSSDVIRTIATEQPAFAPFARAPHRWLDVPDGGVCENAGDGDPVGISLRVRAFSVPGTTPGYDGRRAVPGAVIAYEIGEAGSAARALFAPVFSGLNAALSAAIASADVAFLDGTFFTDDELEAQQLMPKRAAELGHQPVGGVNGTLEQVSGLPSRTIFAHLNNSNPLLDPDSEASLRLRQANAEIAYDGMELTL